MKKQYLILAFVMPNLNLVASETSNAAVTVTTGLAAAVTAVNIYHILTMPKTNGVMTSKAETALASAGFIAMTAAMVGVLENKENAVPALCLSAAATTARRVLARRRLRLSQQLTDAPESGLLPTTGITGGLFKIAGFDTWQHPDLVAARSAAYKDLGEAEDRLRKAEADTKRPWLN